MNRSRILNWGIFALALLLLSPALALAQGNGNGNNNRQQLNPQPVLIYTVTGGTLAGQGETFETLIVYSNGMAIWTGSGAGGGTDSGGGGTGGTSDGIQTIQLSQQQINTLLRDLRRSGAFRGNTINTGNDGDDSLPMTTITVFFNPTGSGRSLAQTFSFFGAQGNRGRANNVITNFINNNFGDGSGSGQ
jgi:hypothetical protein